MKKLSTPNISVPNIKLKRWAIYTIAGTVLGLILFSFAVVKQVQAERAQAETARLQQAQTAQLEKQRIEQSRKTTAQLTAISAEKQAVCDWIASMAKDKSRRLVSPPLCRK